MCRYHNSRQRTCALCEEQEQKLAFETCFRCTGAFHEHYTSDALFKEKVVKAARNELDEMASFHVMQWRRKLEKSACDKVIST